MVVFTCNHCGDSLQKPKVEKHYQVICRTSKNLTCVDCFKDFKNEDYAAHIKCMTEDERYAAKGSLPNGVVKKGEVKQQSWTDLIKGIMEKEDNLSMPLKNMMNIVASYVNVPRKKAKFINFVMNSFGRRYNIRDVEAIWNLIEKHKHKQMAKIKESTALEQHSKQISKRKIESEAGTVQERKKKKDNCENKDINNHISESKENIERNGTNEEKFSFEAKIIEVLSRKGEITLKKLQNKVLNAYIKFRNLEEFTEKHAKKFNKRLRRMPEVEINDGVVILL